MIVKCLSVTYAPQQAGAMLLNPMDPNPPVPQVGNSATVVFTYGDETDLPRVEQFALTISGVTEPMEYFPGEFYDLSLDVVAPPEPVN